MDRACSSVCKTTFLESKFASARFQSPRSIYLKMNSFRVARNVVTAQRRNMSVKDMFENTNKIQGVRKTFYSNPEAGAANPTYLKENGDKAVVGVAFTFMTIGVLTIFNGLWNMSFGIHKVAGK